jgi:cation transport protein ChaC
MALKHPLKIEDGAWVFGYGSLMWRPNFPHTESRTALLRGYHRALCIYSTQYRGTYERPGLVAGLDRGGSCRGRAFHVAAADWKDVEAYLWEREMTDRVYRPVWHRVETPAGPVAAYTFVADRTHVKYTGRLSNEQALDLVMQGCGKRGSCLEYLKNTVEHLNEMGIRTGQLHEVLDLARRRGLI